MLEAFYLLDLLNLCLEAIMREYYEVLLAVGRVLDLDRAQ